MKTGNTRALQLLELITVRGPVRGAAVAAGRGRLVAVTRAGRTSSGDV